MSRFLRSTGKPLFIYAGVVQPSIVKTLYTSGILKDKDIQNLIDFCYPLSKMDPGPYTYINRFKSSNGIFYNVFCLRDQTSFIINHNNKAPSKNQQNTNNIESNLNLNEHCSLCIVSEYNEYLAFEEILKMTRNLLLNKVEAAEMYLRNIIHENYYRSNEKIWNCLQQTSKVSDNIPLKIIGLLITALISDTSCIVVSSNLEKLSKFCYELQFLICPLKWHHIFVPILPKKFIDTIQSPSPFIVGLHRTLLKKALKDEVDGHLLIDIDDKIKIDAKKIEVFPNWALSIAKSSLQSNELQDRQTLIMKLICKALGIQMSNSLQVTVKRINSAMNNIHYQTNTFSCSLLNSRTLISFFDAIKENTISKEYKKMIERSCKSNVTSLAIQKVDEFPITKRKPKVHETKANFIESDSGSNSINSSS
ncbi:hypothetical protein TRFO_36736 [Tritrichomonas foetus]|uniref:UDENN domain-containing protein n=1 Tax=Tritrichomonas foetus TaxID=1144522 RepID=A0A1J4JHN9_9EUKA|nr:hypothetical protein TRFO_36736 [Tritrichomonas foetus]|eukprot:OHS97123.1 hypothetical protein TRFO_36736 [Tritrichomonas foetus]